MGEPNSPIEIDGDVDEKDIAAILAGIEQQRNGYIENGETEKAVHHHRLLMRLEVGNSEFTGVESLHEAISPPEPISGYFTLQQ